TNMRRILNDPRSKPKWGGGEDPSRTEVRKQILPLWCHGNEGRQTGKNKSPSDFLQRSATRNSRTTNVCFAHSTLDRRRWPGHCRGNPHANKAFDNDQGWERLDGYEYRTYNQSQVRPPGWSKGKKTGWGNCGLPQAKRRSTAAVRPTIIRVGLTTIIKTTQDR